MLKLSTYRTVKVVAAAGVLACAGQIALADGPYYGGGLAIYSSKSAEATGSPVESEDVYGAIGATVGYRWDRGTTFFGLEADADIAFNSDFEYANVECSVAADGPYYCEHDATLRLRGVIGGPVGAFEGFASLGVAAMQGQGATSPTTTDRGVNTGYTVGLGLQNDLANGKMRYEIVYDNFENTTTKPGGIYEPDFESVSFKVSYLFN